jgi:hypothetical protein
MVLHVKARSRVRRVAKMANKWPSYLIAPTPPTLEIRAAEKSKEKL